MMPELREGARRGRPAGNKKQQQQKLNPIEAGEAIATRTRRRQAAVLAAEVVPVPGVKEEGNKTNNDNKKQQHQAVVDKLGTEAAAGALNQGAKNPKNLGVLKGVRKEEEEVREKHIDEFGSGGNNKANAGEDDDNPAPLPEKFEEEEDDSPKMENSPKEEESDFSHDSDFESDIDEEEFARYMHLKYISDGFDVDFRPRGVMGGPYIVKDLDEINQLEERLREHVYHHAKFAIKHYNEHENANLEFVELVKVNMEFLAGTMYYITFIGRNRKRKKK